ncbi:hypothetical protein ABIA32_002708 [Streptacidiphilus sp. MAP12-20]|uniref:hypothetical protein n=1 Tax=Streptacidiphilus sp. MAP12-20 TaxID=3156299 RepID=UPI003517E907
MNWATIWPTLAFFLGGLSSYARDALTEKRQRHRLAAERSAERARVTLDRREAFELDHLQRLNDALQDLGRAAGRMHYLDTMASHQTGIYAGPGVPEDASTALLDANRSVHTLKGLVLDDELREKVAETQRLLNIPSSMHNSTPAEAERAFEPAIRALDETQAAVSARIREIYISQAAAQQLLASGVPRRRVIPS